MLQLEPYAQNYAWGRRGNESLVGKLMKVDESKREIPFAELWMGTHPSGPNKLTNSQDSLLSWLHKNPTAVGIIPDGYPSDDLPFLFKVLSIEKALSIQSHPDKALAQRLHREFPSLYKDGNHKPEMVIALTEFRCMCSFRSLDEILDLARNHFSEFADLLKESGYDLRDSSEKSLASLFSSYIKSDKERVKEHLSRLVRRLSEKPASSLSLTEETILLLYNQFPGDVGVFAPILLNCLILQPGQSFFIGANEPHAYIRGDCLECMALSDNVVRAGLTEKHKDVDILCAMLNYHAGHPHWIEPVRRREGGVSVTLYRPPYSLCSEFAVEEIQLEGNQAYRLDQPDISSILLVMSGQVKFTLSEGEGELEGSNGAVIFIGAGNTIQIQNVKLDETAVIYRAHINRSEESK